MPADEITQALLNANVRLTEQLIQLATKVIESRIAPVQVASPPPVQPFQFAADDAWDDIPESTKWHVSEEEEDAEFTSNVVPIDKSILEAAGIDPNTLTVA